MSTMLTDGILIASPICHFFIQLGLVWLPQILARTIPGMRFLSGHVRFVGNEAPEPFLAGTHVQLLQIVLTRNHSQHDLSLTEQALRGLFDRFQKVQGIKNSILYFEGEVVYHEQLRGLRRLFSKVFNTPQIF